ncbi:unnamed protein product, partial [Mesorhabditis belari]|uniref:PDZ domain-containing protein n=1 Tax=Mesorhabditis belari TaxID=2138241 RepID=A0AAF3EF00_9BILA
MTSATAGKEMEIEILIEEGEPLGATPNDKLTITKVQEGTVAEGHLQVGDQILKLNGFPLNNANDFFRRLRFAPPVARLTILRGGEKARELATRVHIPADREKLIQRRDGYAYELAKLNWAPGGPKLGLGIKHYQNRVLVSRADPGSLAAACLQIGDHLIDIDGTPVTDKDVARDLLLKALQTKGEVASVIERPVSGEAKHWIQQALATQTAAPPSVQMNSDVRAIAARQRAALPAKATIVPKSILIKPGAAPPKNRRVVVAEKTNKEHMIASDNEGRNLRSVRK